MQGRITQEQFRSQLKSDAERAVDLEMLKTFHEFYASRLEQFASFLQTVATPQRPTDHPGTARKLRAIADSHISDAVDTKAPLWKENLENVFEFLEEMRVGAGLGLICLGDMEAGTAHWLVELVFRRAAEAWQSCKEVADRSQTEPHYLYSTTAAALFQRIWFSRIPLPRTMAEHLRQEYTQARLKLKQQRIEAAQHPGSQSVSSFEPYRRRLGRFLAHDSVFGIWNLRRAIEAQAGTTSRLPPTEMLSMIWTHFCDVTLPGELQRDAQVMVGLIRSLEAISKQLVAGIEDVPLAKRDAVAEVYGRFQSDLNRFLQDIELFITQSNLPDYGFSRLPGLSEVEAHRKGEGEPYGQPMNEPAAVDIAIITVLREEATAVRALLGDTELAKPTLSFPRNLYAWEWGTVQSPRFERPYTVAHALVGHAGGTPGYGATLKTIERWNPTYVLLVGIAGGLGTRISRGDVALSTHIYGYEYGKLEGQKFTPRPDWNHQVDNALLRSAVTMADRDSTWHAHLPKPPSAPEFTPKVLEGPIASGDKVVDHQRSSFFRKVSDAWNGKLIAVEVEGAGAAAAVAAAREAGMNPGFLMVRGISDIPPSDASSTSANQTSERDTWKDFAAAAAAGFAAHFIKQGWPIAPRVDGAGS